MFITISRTVIGTIGAMFLPITMGYTLAKQDFPFRKGILIYVIATMILGGGLIPTYEMYATTLHYAPCSVNENQFRAVIVLPCGTNTALAEKHADPLLVAKNKWLIDHPESGLPDNMVLGLYGENRIV